MLLKDSSVFLTTNSAFQRDNISILAIVSNHVFHSRTKHIQVDYHFIHERVLQKDPLVKFILSKDQLANFLTKGLPSPQFQFLITNHMAKTSHLIEGGCKDRACRQERAANTPTHQNRLEPTRPTKLCQLLGVGRLDWVGLQKLFLQQVRLGSGHNIHKPA